MLKPSREPGSASVVMRNTLSQLGKISRDLQNAAMRMRTVPVHNTFQKMARLTREGGARRARKWCWCRTPRPSPSRQLGDACFLFCDDVPASVGPLEGKLAEATISFQSPCAGSITLRMPWPLALEAAANLLGTEPDDPEAEESALAAVGELLNMISGSALQAWFGAATVWSLGVPLTSMREGQLPSPSPRGGVVGYVIDDTRIEIEAIEGGAGDDQGPHR